MAALLKQDYAKILKARAGLVMISPDSLEQHRPYAFTRFGARLPCLYVPDSSREIAPRYGRRVRGFYYRSLGYSRNYPRASAATRKNGEPSVHDLSPGLPSGKRRIKKLEAQMSACSSAHHSLSGRVRRVAIDDRSL
jgi:hypothetical protein